MWLRTGSSVRLARVALYRAYCLPVPAAVEALDPSDAGRALRRRAPSDSCGDVESSVVDGERPYLASHALLDSTHTQHTRLTHTYEPTNVRCKDRGPIPAPPLHALRRRRFAAPAGRSASSGSRPIPGPLSPLALVDMLLGSSQRNCAPVVTLGELRYGAPCNRQGSARPTDRAGRPWRGASTAS